MTLELSKNLATSFLDYAKKARDYVKSSQRRDIEEARNYYRNYETALKRAAKKEQELLDWEIAVEALKSYEPDREMPGNIEDLMNNLRSMISKGRDEPEEEGN